MNWGSASEFFAMGGYGLYVWGSYGVALLLMAVEPVLARRRRRNALRDAASAELFADPQEDQGG
jgi:heme exporter protein D